MILEMMPTLLMRAFHVPEVVVDCGKPDDFEGTACAAFLMWRMEYPDYSAKLRIPEQPEAEKALNRALFRRRAA
jgi:hypothetical protein